MTSRPNQPDQAARWVSHAVVGLGAAAAVTAFVTRKQTPGAQIIGAIVAIAAHELLDAPLASVLGEVGL